MNRWFWGLIFVLIAACSGPARPGPGGIGAIAPPPPGVGTIVFSAAASLGAAFAEVKTQFEAQHPGSTVLLNLGSTGTLARQVEQGAPSDLLALAAREPMDRLAEKGLVDHGAVWTLATGEIVLIQPAGSPPLSGWEGLTGVTYIAVGNPDHVPAGQYGQAVLRHLGLLEQVRSRLVYGEDARQVLHYVESGEAGAGLVYRTDAAAAARVRVVAAAPAGSHPPVIYPAAVLKGAPNRAGAEALAQFLRSEGGRAVLARHGFGGGGP